MRIETGYLIVRSLASDDRAALYAIKYDETVSQ
jgi:hypothetical protein